MGDWIKSLLKELEKHPLKEPGQQLTAAFFILACWRKNFTNFKGLPNSLIKMVVLKPDLEKRTCPDYQFLDKCLSDRCVIEINHGNMSILATLK
jgi:hypothetical protein